MLKWNSFTGIVGMQTNTSVDNRVVCVGDGVEFKDGEGKLHKGVVVIYSSDVGVLFDSFFGDRFACLKDIEILHVLQEYTDIKVSSLNSIAGYRIEAFRLDGLKDFKY